MRARTLLDFSQYGTEEEFKKQLSKMLSRLKLKGASKEALEAIAVELRSIYVETLQKLSQELTHVNRLYLDKPEDRLWHASDKTWWRRLAVEESPKGDFDFDLFKAPPPPEIEELILAAASYCSETRALSYTSYGKRLHKALWKLGVETGLPEGVRNARAHRKSRDTKSRPRRGKK